MPTGFSSVQFSEVDFQAQDLPVSRHPAGPRVGSNNFGVFGLPFEAVRDTSTSTSLDW